MQSETYVEKLSQTLEKIEGAYSPATIRAYRADFLSFITFCEKNGYEAIPGAPKAVADFIEYLVESSLRSSSIRRAVAGIAAIHRINRFSDPTKDPDVTLALKRMHRKLGRFSKQAHPVDKSLLQKLIGVTDNSPRGMRNRAMLLIAFDTLCRRSELVSLRIEDIKFEASSTGEEMSSRILLRRSKTDPYAQGRWLELGETSTQALSAWINSSTLSAGPIFRSLHDAVDGGSGLTSGQVNRILKRLAKTAGLTPESVRAISGHSLRVGAARDLMRQGASMPLIMKRGRWSKTDTVMRYLEHWESLTQV